MLSGLITALMAQMQVEPFNPRPGVTVQVGFVCTESFKKRSFVLFGGAGGYVEMRKKFIERLGDTYDAFVVGYRDHDKSSHYNPAGMSIDSVETYVDDMHLFFQNYPRLNGKKATAGGYSWGAQVLSRLVQKYGTDNIERLVYIAPMVDVFAPYACLPRFCIRGVSKFLAWYVPNGCAFSWGTFDEICDEVAKTDPEQAALMRQPEHEDKLLTKMTWRTASAMFESIEKLKQWNKVVDLPVSIFLANVDNKVDNWATYALMRRMFKNVYIKTFDQAEHALLDFPAAYEEICAHIKTLQRPDKFKVE